MSEGMGIHMRLGKKGKREKKRHAEVPRYITGGIKPKLMLIINVKISQGIMDRSTGMKVNSRSLMKNAELRKLTKEATENGPLGYFKT